MELKKRASIRLGFVFGMQDIDSETDAVVNDHVVNVWGASYERLEVEEAVLFEARLQETCGKDLMALMEKAMKVAADFGMETIVGVEPGKK
jgi:hypothetical protein